MLRERVARTAEGDDSALTLDLLNSFGLEPAEGLDV